jgi:hypothetical protein
VPYPPGVDVGAATVQVVLELDSEGNLVPTRWSGPEPLVAAVAEVLPRCELQDPGTITWTFPEPPVNVSGTVWSRGDRARLQGLTVVVGESAVRTDARGQFSLRNVAPGRYSVRLADPGWRLPDPVELTVEEGEHAELVLWVSPERAVRDELVASYDADEPSGVVRTVGIDAARAVPGTLGDPVRALVSEPGLSRSPYDAGWLLVRGGEYDEVGLFLDGVPVPLVYHLGGFTSVLHPEMIEAVRFWPGLFPARYGQATSGAADLVLRDPGDRPHAVGGLNLVFAHAFAETPTRFGAVSLAARRSWLDGVLALALDPQSARIAPRFWDVSSSWRVQRARLTLVAMQDSMDAPSSDGEELLHIDQHAVQLQAKLPVGELVTVSPWLAWTRRDITGGKPITFQRIDELYPGLRLEARGRAPRWTLGLEGQRHRYLLQQVRDEVDETTRQAPVWTVDPYAGLTVGSPVELWTEMRLTTAIVEGQRLQPFRLALSPRTGLRTEPAPGLQIRAEWGRLHQLPLPQLLVSVAEGVYLDYERADQWAVGASWVRGPLSADVDGWVRFAQALAELEIDQSIGESQGRAAGLESRLQLEVSGLRGSVLYQYTRSDKREDPGDAWQPSPFETPHRLELLAIQQLPRAVTASARWRWTSGFPRVREGDDLLPQEAYDILLQEQIELDTQGRARLQPFHALDLRLARQFDFRAWRLEASLEVQNVYSRRVVEPVITGFGESRPTYGVGLPVLPIFALDGSLWPMVDRSVSAGVEDIACAGGLGERHDCELSEREYAKTGPDPRNASGGNRIASPDEGGARSDFWSERKRAMSAEPRSER